MPRHAPGDLERLPSHGADGALHVVVESPAGSALKLAFDPELYVFKLSRPLVLGLSYPFDWGFVPGTRAQDGDPLDAMVLLDAPAHPGVLVECRPLGAVLVTQAGKRGRERNDRIIAIPIESRRFQGMRRVSDLSHRTREEIEAFFRSAVLLEGKEVEIEGWAGPRKAASVIDEAVKRFRPRAGTTSRP